MAIVSVDPAAVLRRYDLLYQGDSNFRTLWQELTDFTIPRKSNVIDMKTAGTKRVSPLMYDSTAPNAVTVLSSAIHGSLTDPKFLWFGLDFELDELNDDADARKWLEASRIKLAKATQRSNFDAEIQEVYAEVVSVATGANFLDSTPVLASKRNPSGFGGFRHQSIPIGTYVIAENELGEVDTLMAVHKLTYNQALKKFGKAALPDKFIKALEAFKGDELVDILHAVYPREGARARAEQGTAAKRLPWASQWIAKDDKHLLQEGGFHEFPFQVTRWTKQSGEKWGRGPGEIALPDVRTLNEAVKLRLQAWASAVRPPLEARDRGVVGKPDVRPGAVNYVKEMGNIKPLGLAANFDVANFNEERLQQRIESVFFIDKLQLPMKSIITATEANQRVRMMHRILGPALGRLDDELLRRMIVRKWNLMLRAGVFDPIPESVLEAADKNIANIDVRFEGPLARAQREQELEAMQSFVSSFIPLAEAVPEVLDKVDFDLYVDKAAQATSMTVLIRPEKEVKKRRAERAEQAAAMQQAAQTRENLKAAGQAAPALREVAAAQGQQVEPRV